MFYKHTLAIFLVYLWQNIIVMFMDAIFIIIALFVMIAGITLYLGGAGFVDKLFPASYIKRGDKVSIYINGKYNRTATVSKIGSNRFYIYDQFPIPVGYRGKFYATAQDESYTFLFLKNRHFHRLAGLHEICRRIFDIPDDENQMIQDTDFETAEEVTDDTDTENDDQ